MATLEELEGIVLNNSNNIVTLQDGVASNAALISENALAISVLQVTSEGQSENISDVINDLSDTTTRLATIEADLYDTGDYSSFLRQINLTLDTHSVGISGNSGGVFNALQQAYDAYTRSVVAEINANGYTDTAIQRLKDEFLVYLSQAYSDAVNEANRISRNNDAEAQDSWEASWSEKYNEMMDQANQALNFYNEMTAWTDNTYNVLIPAIQAEIQEAKEQAEEARQLAQDKVDGGMQDMIEMAGRWRDLAGSINDMKEAVINMDYSNYEARDDIYRRISADFNDRFSSYDERITSAAGENSAVADKVEQMQITVAEQKASIDDVSRVLIDETTQLSQQITALSVGSQTQFDTAQIWHFDTSNEGWNGLWNDGWLIVNNNSIQSVALNIDATKYRQVKMRIRKVGNPTWDGRLVWVGSIPASSIPIDEPDWSTEYAELTINPGWSGILTRLIVYLSTDADVNNYFILDWITVGRPAPGASTAELLSERTARIEQDAVTAERVDVLSAELNTLNGQYAGAAEAIQGLQTSVNTIEGGIESVSESVTLLSSNVTDVVTGLTGNSEAIQGLVTRTTATEQSITSISEEMTRLDAKIGTSVGTAFEELSTTVTKNKDDIKINSDKLTLLEANLGDYAKGSALSSLSVTVGQNAAGLHKIVTEDLVNLNASLGNKASSSALQLLQSTVDENVRGVRAVSQRVDTLEVEIPKKASASAFDQLKTAVNHSETGLAATANKITSLNATLRDNVEAWSLSYVKSKVTDDLAGNIRAHTTALDTYGTQIGRVRANGTFRVDAVATLGNARTRIGLIAEATSTSRSYSSALYLQANTNGSSEVQVVANRFSVINHPNGSQAVAPFIISGGKIYLNASTVIKEADIGTLHLRDGAVSDFWSVNSGSDDPTITMTAPQDMTVLVMTTAYYGGSYSGFSRQTNIYYDGSRVFRMTSSVSDYTQNITYFYTRFVPKGRHTFKMDVTGDTLDIVHSKRMAIFGFMK